MEWYHGTRSDFPEFDGSFVGQGNDQLGSGFYFTDRLETAEGYAWSEDGAGWVLTVDPGIENPMPADARFTRDQIEALLRASPDFDDLIENFGETGFEGEAAVVGRAVAAYEDMLGGHGDALAMLNAVSNDFWQGAEAAFLRTVHSVTGHDGLFRKSGEETHAVAWLPERIRVLSRREHVPEARRAKP